MKHHSALVSSKHLTKISFNTFNISNNSTRLTLIIFKFIEGVRCLTCDSTPSDQYIFIISVSRRNKILKRNYFQAMTKFYYLYIADICLK